MTRKPSTVSRLARGMARGKGAKEEREMKAVKGCSRDARVGEL